MSQSTAIEPTEPRDYGVDNRGTLDLTRAFKLRFEKHLTYKEIGSLLGVSKQAVHKALKPFVGLAKHPEATGTFKDNEAVLIDSARFQILRNLVDPERLKKASVNNLGYAYQALYNAQRLERGESTANIAYHDIDKSLGELQGDIAKLEAELGATNDT